MSKLKGFLLSCALVLISGAANSQTSININDATGASVIPSADIQSIDINPVTNVISITTRVPYTVQLQEDPCTDACEPVAPTITLFNVSSPVAVGESVMVNWSTTANATSCTPSGDYSGWTGLPNISTNGTGIPVPMSEVGTFTFGLTCYNDQLASTTETRTVTVNEVVVNPVNACANYASPLSGNIVPWENFFSRAFPLPGSEDQIGDIPRYGYLALEFNTANIVDTGALMTIETTTTSGRRLGSVSQCPGDFNVASECKFSWGTSGGIIWSTDNYARSCILDPDTTYYFNLTFTDGYVPSTTQCRDSKCQTILSVYNP